MFDAVARPEDGWKDGDSIIMKSGRTFTRGTVEWEDYADSVVDTWIEIGIVASVGAQR